MKKNKLTKVISLLGVSSLLSLSISSCTSIDQVVTKRSTQPTNTQPNVNKQPSKPVENSNNNANDNSNNDNNSNNNNSNLNENNIISNNNDDNNNGGNTNPETLALQNAKTSLKTLIDAQSDELKTYADYAKIKQELTDAYTSASDVNNKEDSTVEDVKTAETTLQNAIDKAKSDKSEFDSANQPLVTAYNELKTTLQSNTNVLERLSQDQYINIRNKVSEVFNIGADITTKSLDSLSDFNLAAENITKANTDITEVVTKLSEWMGNADKFNDFKKKVLSKDQLTAGTGANNNQEQPTNWSFAAFSVDLPNSNNLQNLSFSQRKVWMNNMGTTSLVSSPVSSTDVSWIYKFAGDGAKYTLRFDYYGPSTGYLYFPYKLVKNSDANNIALQYKLNDATEQTSIIFGNEENASGPAPTVDNINVAKVTIPNLNFGSNTIEFSVPTTKIAPMIGNMYLTSNAGSESKIHDQIFGNANNTNDTQTSVSVNLLKGYGLTAGWSTYIGEFPGLTRTGETPADSNADEPNYLVGYIAGPAARRISTNTGAVTTPSASTTRRTLTIYVNAPMAGDYYFNGTYISTDRETRSLKFESKETTNSVTINVRATQNFTSLEKFNTGDMSSNVVTNGMKRTIHFDKGINKIVVSGGSKDTPFIGNLTFTLNSTPASNAGGMETNPSA
ncbi:FIVAR domain-containing protein [Mycoplasma tullyi]|uniref:FIVAR domain-containing protein n=1 Tax=Mycoplasma tullyi TaxID=1612150 RepID=A0A7D7UBX9_9MOLU|nr:FIVAR domain-containing protein [Mycoplasma tullyi]QMT98807.1 FIVAR domain-containing protein [Mycoplasma tullyi]